MKHTSEPWEIGYSNGSHCDCTESAGAQIRNNEIDEDVVQGGTCDNFAPVGVLRKEDAERIINCVNACKSIPNEQLLLVSLVDGMELRAEIGEHVITPPRWHVCSAYNEGYRDRFAGRPRIATHQASGVHIRAGWDDADLRIRQKLGEEDPSERTATTIPVVLPAGNNS